MTPVMGAQSLNQWTAREVLLLSSKLGCSILLLVAVGEMQKFFIYSGY